MKYFYPDKLYPYAYAPDKLYPYAYAFRGGFPYVASPIVHCVHDVPRKGEDGYEEFLEFSKNKNVKILSYKTPIDDVA